MTPEMVTSIGIETIKVVLMLAVPVLFAGLAVGLLISMFQAITQIQEMTLTFVPKIVVVFLALLVLMPWMLEVIMSFTSRLFNGIPGYVG